MTKFVKNKKKYLQISKCHTKLAKRFPLFSMVQTILFYSFLHTGSHVPFRQLEIEPQDTWEDLRYRLEKRHGLHAGRNSGMPRHSHYGESYFVGWLYNPGWTVDQYRAMPMLSSTYVCQPEDRVLVACLPLNHDQRPYVPLRYRSLSFQREVVPENVQPHAPKAVVFGPDMTEEEKLRCLMDTVNYETMVVANMQQAFQQHRVPRKQYHASEGKAASRPPPPSYTCYRCQQKGHWRNECPSLTDPNYVAPRVFKPPTGIPKTMLRVATTDQDKQSAMRTATGEFVLSTIQEGVFERYAQTSGTATDPQSDSENENSDMIE
jgi:hypothetical protein